MRNTNKMMLDMCDLPPARMIADDMPAVSSRWDGIAADARAIWLSLPLPLPLLWIKIMPSLFMPLCAVSLEGITREG